MNILNMIRLALWSPEMPEDPETARRESVRRILRRSVRGNPRLQWGQYVTREDLEKEREKALSYDFGD